IILDGHPGAKAEHCGFEQTVSGSSPVTGNNATATHQHLSEKNLPIGITTERAGPLNLGCPPACDTPVPQAQRPESVPARTATTATTPNPPHKWPLPYSAQD